MKGWKLGDTGVGARRRGAGSWETVGREKNRTLNKLGRKLTRWEMRERGWEMGDSGVGDGRE